ncbi:MAG: SusC/RagA family TonB-linked outer membrane protein [Chitinophagaceae bacterium]|nr:SusC/RagA family TonB-linked outer membrane protein [Chitinophagaceae bacterium]
MELLLKGQPLTYRIAGNTIALSQKNAAPVIKPLLADPLLLVQITGKVTDENGNPVAGATVQVKGRSQTAAVTDNDGSFSIDVDNDATLIISSVGYVSKEIPVAGKSVLDITLQTDKKNLSEVIVTALGIERNTKVLQFSATKVDGDNFTQARENNTANALAGRVAGVNVTKIASGPGGSSRVVIRGAKTLGSSNNQPLYVIDGIPMDNTNYGQAGTWGGADAGDGMSSINPDDIESMTVLKGASAAALYGSRAAQGVILITTRTGRGSKGIGVELNSNYVMESVNNITDMQKTYGVGGYVGNTLETQKAEKATTLDQLWNNNWTYNGWGPKLDGSPTVWFDGTTHPYSYTGDNWKKFYDVGHSYTNSISLTGGSATQNFRASLSNLNSNGVVPNSRYDRINGTLSANSKFGKKLRMDAKVMYTNERVKNRPGLSDAPGNGINTMYFIPNNVDVRSMIGDPDKPGAVPSLALQDEMGIIIADGKDPGEEYAFTPDIYTNNPYWVAYQYINSDVRNRIISSGLLRYDFTNYLYAQVRIGYDFSTKRGALSTPEGTGYRRAGELFESETRVSELNMEGIVGFEKTFNKIGVKAFVGGNQMRGVWENLTLAGRGFNTRFLSNISNATQKTYGYDYGKSGINSLFGSAELSFNDYLFLTATARQDWFSVLNPETNSIFYPSVGASFVFSDAFKGLPEWLSFGKLRASWAQVGNASSVGSYSTIVSYLADQTHVNSNGQIVPIGRLNSQSNLPNSALVPYTSTETEFGIDIRFLNNRLGLDFTYYAQKTTNDILNAGISDASGFLSTTVNLGQIRNRGIEFLLSVTPYKSRNLTWDMSLNFAKNNSKVISLIEGQTQLGVDDPRTYTAAIYHIVGQPYGMITGLTQKKDPATGLLMFDQYGSPLASDEFSIIGRGVPDFTGGFTNSLTWKGFNLSFLIDFKSGSDVFSGTNVMITKAGFHKQTLLGREGEAPLVVSGLFEDKDNPGTYKQETRTLIKGEASSYWNNLGDRTADRFTYDASFVKLRQITLGYSLPSKLLNNTPFKGVMFSVVARNLAILYKNTENIDPESSYTNLNGQGLDYFGFPATRTYGCNLRLTF